jgi:methylmalonyl-CoA/ethylmalonyl-CoA epimerase
VDDLANSQIGQISVTVKDVARAVAFYREVLGLQYLFEAPRMAFFDCGGVRLFLDIPEQPEFDHPSSTLYFAVDNIEETYASLVDRGVEFIGEPHLIAKMPDHDLWMAFFRDTEGNVLALMCEKRPPAG